MGKSEGGGAIQRSRAAAHEPGDRFACQDSCGLPGDGDGGQAQAGGQQTRHAHESFCRNKNRNKSRRRQERLNISHKWLAQGWGQDGGILGGRREAATHVKKIFYKPSSS